MLLLVALLCLLLGVIFLWLEVNKYGGLFNVKGQLSGLSAPVVSGEVSIV
jgi:hypothetical protein